MSPSMRILVATLALAATPAFSETYSVVSTATTQHGPLTKTDVVVQAGSNSLSRFTMHRVRRMEGGTQGSLLLLPPIGPSSFVFYEFDENGDYLKSFAAFYALRGYDVWGYSARHASIAPGTCEQPGNPCAIMQSWNLASVVDDIQYIRDQIELEHPGRKPVVGGHSAGSMYAVATINAHPDAYQAALLWEGTLYSADPAVRTLNQQWCSLLEGSIAQGTYFDASIQGFKALAFLSMTQPNDPTPAPGFPPGTTNRQAFMFLLTSSVPGPFSQPTPSYVLAGGDPVASELFYADEDRVTRSALQFANYVPLPLGRDIDCGLAGETTHTANLANFTAPLYVIEAGRGFGATMTQTAQATSSSQVTYNRVDVFGHIDHWASARHRQFVERPILHWLKTQVFHP